MNSAFHRTCHRSTGLAAFASIDVHAQELRVTLDDLEANDGGTLLRLTQERLPEGYDAVRQGWEHYLDRLVVIAEGRDPGSDPLVETTTR